MHTGQKSVYDHLYANTNYGMPEASIGLGMVTTATEILNFRNVVDVGCGAGYAILEFFKNGKQAKGIETCSWLLANPLRSLVATGIVKYGSITHIPYGVEEFDLVFCCEVLEHLDEKDVDRALSELVRVSRRWIFATVGLTDSVYGKGIHLTVRPFNWWKEKFEQFKLKPHRLTGQQRGSGMYVYRKD